MTVMDASVVVEIVLRTAVGMDALDRLIAKPDGMQAPHLVDVEVTHVLRRLVLAREVSTADAAFAIDTLAQLRLERHAHLLLLPRIWDLRNSLSAYDAAYVALAEALDTPLMTCDARLSRSRGHRANIVLLA